MNWDYIAGFVDGEGSILIPQNKRVKISIYNTNRESLEEIKNFIGYGTIRFVDRNPGKWKPSGIYSITNSRKIILPILEELKDRCIIKKEKINEAIEFIKEKKWYRDKYVDIQLIKKLRNEGKSYREIAKTMNIAHETVRKRYLLSIRLY